MATRHWKMRLGAAGHNSELWLDGEKVTNARAVSIASTVESATTVTVEYINCDVELEADEVQDITAMGDPHKKHRFGGAS